jgi:hypothetical protein
MDPPGTGVDPACTDLADRWERAKQSEGEILCRYWGKLSGGGPIHINRGTSASTGTITAQKNDLRVAGAKQNLVAIVQAPGFTTRSIDQDCTAKEKLQPRLAMVQPPWTKVTRLT